MAGLIGRKLGMARIFDGQGKAVLVTVIEAGPCAVTQVKTKKLDGYDSLQLAFENKKEKNVNKPEAGHFSKAGVKAKRIVREFRGMDDAAEVKPGDEIGVDAFGEGQRVSVTGISKGKGFQGVVKRHGFAGGPKSHGQSDRMRAPGSIGQASYPARVFKGIKMGGRMGNDRVTLRKRRVVRIIPEKNILMLEGTVPGANSGIVLIKS